MISIFCAKNGAEVTSSDINKVAIGGIIQNAEINNVKINIIKSDLFDDIANATFDIIIINLPFYPKQVITEHDYAWFCGERFDYFKKLFKQLSMFLKPACTVIMILSEECRISEIKSIAIAHGLATEKIYSEMVWGGENYIFDIRINQQGDVSVDR